LPRFLAAADVEVLEHIYELPTTRPAEVGHDLALPVRRRGLAVEA
jgi:hypothetical protein